MGVPRKRVEMKYPKMTDKEKVLPDWLAERLGFRRDPKTGLLDDGGDPILDAFDPSN